MRRDPRNERGAVLPLVMVATLLLVGFLAFAVDVTRTILAVQQLQFAAESAALDAFSQITDADGAYPADRGLANARNAVAISAGGSPWNVAPSGPQSLKGQYNTGVAIDSSDVIYDGNPGDTAEPVLRVTARRTGSEALRYFFLPAIFAMNAMTGGTVPAAAQSASPYRTIEVIGAPASRIGAGAPRAAAQPSAVAGWATLPLAVSYTQFKDASLPTETRSLYDVDVLDSTKPFVGGAPAGKLRAAFVNVVQSGTGSAYYGTAQGNADINQLISSLKYFTASPDVSAVAPAIVERGSKLWCFDAGNAAFKARQAEIAAAVRNLPTGRNYIIPIVNTDPALGQQLTVVGFAYLQLTRTVTSATLPTGANEFVLRVQFGESLPVRNATSAILASVPAVTGDSLPAPPSGGPFQNRTYDSTYSSISPRFRGVCMAPVASARAL